MISTNYLVGIVRILETPRHEILDDQIPLTQFKAKLEQRKNPLIVNLTFWGSLAYDLIDHYQLGDYILIEGYLSLQDNEVLTDSSKLKKINLTILKVYKIY